MTDAFILQTARGHLLTLREHPQCQASSINFILRPGHGSRGHFPNPQCDPVGVDLSLHRRSVGSHPSTAIGFGNEELIVVDRIDGIRQPVRRSRRNTIQTAIDGIDVIAAESTGPVGRIVQDTLPREVCVLFIESRIHHISKRNRFGVGTLSNAHAIQVPSCCALLPQRGIYQHGIAVVQSHASLATLHICLGPKVAGSGHQPQAVHCGIVIPKSRLRVSGNAFFYLQCHSFLRAPTHCGTRGRSPLSFFLEPRFFTSRNEVGGIEITGPFEIVFELRQSRLVETEIHIFTPFAQCDPQVPPHQGQPARFT